MTYLRPRKTPASRRARFLSGLAAGLCVLAALVIWRAPWIFPGLFMAIASPFWRAEFSIQSGALESPAQLLAENESLKRQLSDLELSIASSSVEAVLEQDSALKAMLGRASTTPSIVAAVLARPPASPYDELIIDRGMDDGVASGTLVYSPERVLIGRVTALYGHASAVLLFTSPGQTYQVFIGDSDIPAVAVGRGGGQYQSEAPHGSAVQIGDVVSDPSIDDPEFGIVSSVTTDPSDPFDQVLIAPPVNIYQLRWVLVDMPDAAPAPDPSPTSRHAH